ncbi:MAG: SsrA-binding protein SmpB [Alphaproteobacteria bacterium]
MSKKKTKTFENRKARYNYEIIQKFEAGLVLNGNEVRSIREGKLVIENSYAVIKKKEIWLLNLFIDLKKYKIFSDSDNLRPKKLLLGRKQIEKISLNLKNTNNTLIPLNIHYNQKGFLKVDIALSRGRKKADLREYKKQQDWKKEKSRLENL